MNNCANCQQPAPEGERLCGPCFNADFLALTDRLKDPTRIKIARLETELRLAGEYMAAREAVTVSLN